MKKIPNFVAVIFLVVMMMPIRAETVLIGGSGTDLPTMQILVTHYQKLHPKQNFKVLSSLGSGGGIKALANGHLHIALSSRALKKKERKYPVRVYRYARTPMVFATQVTNPATNISSQTIFSIMHGEKHYWPHQQLIRLVLRPENDSDTLILKKHYENIEESLKKAYNIRGIPVAATDQKAASALETIPGSLGTTSLAIIQGGKRKLKPLILDNIEASIENLKNNTYPLYKDLYFVLPKHNHQSVKSFLNFVQSSTGKRILQETGHLPVHFTVE